jgi:hypothetical protein
MTAKLDEMWAALEAHKPKRGYTKAWATMLKEQTEYSIWLAHCAAPRKSAARAAAAAAAAAVTTLWESAWTAWAAAAESDTYAQEAIDAIKEVKP